MSGKETRREDSQRKEYAKQMRWTTLRLRGRLIASSKINLVRSRGTRKEQQNDSLGGLAPGGCIVMWGMTKNKKKTKGVGKRYIVIHPHQKTSTDGEKRTRRVTRLANSYGGGGGGTPLLPKKAQSHNYSVDGGKSRISVV